MIDTNIILNITIALLVYDLLEFINNPILVQEYCNSIIEVIEG